MPKVQSRRWCAIACVALAACIPQGPQGDVGPPGPQGDAGRKGDPAPVELYATITALTALAKEVTPAVAAAKSPLWNGDVKAAIATDAKMVGIGTQAPKVALDVNGDIAAAAVHAQKAELQGSLVAGLGNSGSGKAASGTVTIDFDGSRAVVAFNAPKEPNKGLVSYDSKSDLMGFCRDDNCEAGITLDQKGRAKLGAKSPAQPLAPLTCSGPDLLAEGWAGQLALENPKSTASVFLAVNDSNRFVVRTVSADKKVVTDRFSVDLKNGNAEVMGELRLPCFGPCEKEGHGIVFTTASDPKVTCDKACDNFNGFCLHGMDKVGTKLQKRGCELSANRCLCVVP